MRSCSLTLVALAALCAGCQGPERNGERYSRARLDDGRKPVRLVASRVQLRSLDWNVAQPVDAPLRLADFIGPDMTWRVVVGPNPGGSPASLTVKLVGGAPDLTVANGWIYVYALPTVQLKMVPFAGSTTKPQGGSVWGVAQTDRVSSTPEGTRFIVQEQGGFHRVFGLDSGANGLRVKLDGAALPNMTNDNWYYQAAPKPPGNANGPIPPANDPLGQLVEYIKGVVSLAGV